MGRRTADRSASNLLLSFWLPAVLYAAVVLFVGSLPNLHPPFSFSNSDKLMHVFEYLVLGLLLTRATRATWRAPVPAALLALCLGIAVGTTDEWHQASVPGRSSSAFDLMADTLGLALAPFALRAIAPGQD